MKNSILLVSVFFCSFCYVNSQHYFSTIIPTPSSVNISHSQIYEDNKLLITYLSYIDTVIGSTIIEFDLQSSEIKFFKYPYYRIAPNGPARIEDRFFCYADDLQRIPAASFFELDNNFEVINKVEYPAWVEDMGVLKTFLFNEHIYNFSLMKQESSPLNYYRLNKTNLQGEIIWNKTVGFEQGIQAIAFLDADLGDDGYIYIGAGIISEELEGTHSTVTKMDTEGNELFEYKDTSDACVWLGSNQEVITFPSGEIVHQTALDKNFNPEYFYNNWFIQPNRYIWLSSEGEYLMDTIFHTHTDEEEGIWGILEGKGDYFYSYGSRYSFPNDTWGLIQKISLDGDLLWSKKYKHPADLDVIDRYHIASLIEQENGDLISTGVYQRQSEIAIPWIMRLNENGCLNPGDCDDIVITSTDPEISGDFDLTSPVLISPNPSTGLFHIDTQLEFSAIRIMSATGEVLKENFDARSEVDLSAFANGLYILELTFDKGVKSSHIVVKK